MKRERETSHHSVVCGKGRYSKSHDGWSSGKLVVRIDRGKEGQILFLCPAIYHDEERRQHRWYKNRYRVVVVPDFGAFDETALTITSSYHTCHRMMRGVAP